MLLRALPYSHKLLAEIIEKGDMVIDATIGNGHDTLFLADLVGPHGKVFGFDVQELALNKTRLLLEEHNYTNYELFLTGHEKIAETLGLNTMIKAAIFNLGYLPNSNKAVITLAETTISAIQQIQNLLVPGGRIILVVYYGHMGGNAEKEAVTNYCTQLPQEDYTVLKYEFINQKNSPPFLLCIEKKVK